MACFNMKQLVGCQGDRPKLRLGLEVADLISVLDADCAMTGCGGQEDG